MKAALYRLGERKILQAGGALWWEAHAGVGAFHSGKCFVMGNILLLGPSEREKPGYLKREFLERLGRLPRWDQTRYYCSNYSIHECRSGKTLTEEELSEREWAGSRAKEKEMEPGPAVVASYRLGQHEITQKDGQWQWRTYSGSGGIRQGRCIVEAGILFLGAPEIVESGDLKNPFIERLQQLPEWSVTSLYCPRCAIYDCDTGADLIREEGNGLLDNALRPGHVLERPSKSDFVEPSPPPPGVPQTPLIPSAPSLLKKVEGLAGKARKTVHRKIRDLFLKCERWQKRKKPDKTIRQIWTHRFPVRKWIAWSAAVVLMAGLLLLILLHDFWEKWENRHEHHDYSAGRHRHR